MDDAKFWQKLETLSPRERQVLTLGLLGREDIEIAKALCLTCCTVRKHFSNLYSHFEIQGNEQKREKLYTLLNQYRMSLVEYKSQQQAFSFMVTFFKVVDKLDPKCKQEIEAFFEDKTIIEIEEMVRRLLEFCKYKQF